MEFGITGGSPHKQHTGCVAVGVFEKRRLSASAKQLDETSEGFITGVLRRGDLQGNLGKTLLLHGMPGVSADRVLLVGCGPEKDFDDAAYRRAIQSAQSALDGTGSHEAVNYLTELAVKDRDTYWKVLEAVVLARQITYRFAAPKSEKDKKRSLRRLVLSVSGRGGQTQGEEAIRHGMATADGMDLARDLGNLPANICTPSHLADEAVKLGRKHAHLTVKILDEKEMEKQGMGALLSVARGSHEPAHLIALEYRGVRSKEQRPVALVGKGVTFDSGGISLKPSAAMDEMKYDMCGAASVLGVVHAVASLKLPINLVGIIPTTENLPGGSASKPGDVVTSLSGKTIEILNTDAEGRLILCDALTYAGQFNPEAVIDIATLTGACLVALGREASGLLGNHQPLADALLEAGRETGDRAWQLPLWDEYQELLKSNFADMANIGGREAGTITAACFLSRFTGDYQWAHLDIAGTAWKTGKAKGATGRPVPLLMRYLLDRARA